MESADFAPEEDFVRLEEEKCEYRQPRVGPEFQAILPTLFPERFPVRVRLQEEGEEEERTEE